MSIVEPLYIVTRRQKRIKGKSFKIGALMVTHLRDEAAMKAMRRCADGQSTVVYECKIVEVHHPSKKARRMRKERLRKKHKH